MADYADVSEVDEIERLYKNYPSATEIGYFCHVLGIEEDTIRTLEEDDAWVYYWELLAQLKERFTEERVIEEMTHWGNLTIKEAQEQLSHLENIQHRKTA
jgi:hypothetical protein